jgi:hypothetical protein
MDALNVISLESAKDNLAIEYDDYNDRITSLIKAAVTWVETYTGWYLYQRNITMYSTSWQTLISAYPVEIGDIKNDKGELLDPQPTPYYNTLACKICCPPQCAISLTVGFSDVTQIPATMIEAAQKLIVYLYENKDMYGIALPTDVQFLLNQHRRSATIL